MILNVETSKKFRYNLEQQLVSWDALSRLDDLRLERQLYPGVALALLNSTATSSTKLVIIIVKIIINIPV